MTRLWAEMTGVQFLEVLIEFSFARTLDWLWCMPSHLLSGYQRVFPPGLKWPKLKFHCSPPSSADVNE